MFKFVRFLIGYVVISVSGENVELLINILLRRKISVWHIKRNSPGNVIFTIHADDFVRNIRSSARKAGCKVKILKKKRDSFHICQISPQKNACYFRPCGDHSDYALRNDCMGY